MDLDDDTRAQILAIAGATRIDRVTQVQSLWGGYGALLRVALRDHAPVIVKLIRPPATRGGPGRADVSHRRKLRSYEVECAFYARYAARCDDTDRVARPLGQARQGGGWLLVLEDLDHAGFARRARDRAGRELDACIAWLARFHARFLGQAPDGLWSEGSYWHLATRREELAALNDTALTARADGLDQKLGATRYRTLIHGDAKPANFCFSGDGRTAAVDFQYVGGGCGMRDLAYLLHGTLSRAAEARAQDAYFDTLRAALAPNFDAADLARDWRPLYPVAVADFERFLAGWRP